MFQRVFIPWLLMSLWDGKFQKELNGSGLFLRWPELLRTYSGQWAAAYRERFMALFEQLTGARVYHIYTIPGGVRGDIPRDKWLRELKDTVEYVKSELPPLRKGSCKQQGDKLSDFDNILFGNYITYNRLEGIGVMDKKFALAEGVTGPNLRAVGVKADVRRLYPYLLYPELDFEVPVLKEGDSLARMLVRRFEIERDLYILE